MKKITFIMALLANVFGLSAQSSLGYYAVCSTLPANPLWNTERILKYGYCEGEYVDIPCGNFIRKGSFSVLDENISPLGFYPGSIKYTCVWAPPFLPHMPYPSPATYTWHGGVSSAFKDFLYYSSNFFDEEDVTDNRFGTETADYPFFCEDDEMTSLPGYAGLFTYAESSDVLDELGTENFTDYRSYIQQKMNKPLQAGKSYMVNIKVSLADASTRATPLSIYFSEDRNFDNLITYGSGNMYTGVLGNTAGFTGPQITIAPITNKNGWVTYSVIYTHTGPNAPIITIGNFFTDVELAENGELVTVPVTSCTNCDNGTFSYYYIDDVSVTELTTECCEASVCSMVPEEPLPEPYLQSVSGNNLGCVSNLAYTLGNASSYPAGHQVQWIYTPTGGTPDIIGTGDNLAFPPGNYAGGGILTVQVAIPYTSCLYEYSINILPCCNPESNQPPAEYTVYYSDGSSGIDQVSELFGPATTIVTNAAIYINGTFIIDQDIEWNTSHAFLGPDAEVIFNNNTTLDLRKTNLQACNIMWKGLYLDHPSETLLVSGSSIEDARTAIKSFNGSMFKLSGSILNRNEYHVSMWTYTAGTHPAIFENTTFSCEDGLGNLTTLNPPLNTGYTKLGIGLMNVKNAAIGTGPGNTGGNIFKYADNHIDAVSSGINVLNADFSNLLNYMSPLPDANGFLVPNKGVAVKVSNPTIGGTTPDMVSVRIGDGTVSGACTFDNYWIYAPSPAGVGIYCDGNITLRTNTNNFSTLEYGIIASRFNGRGGANPQTSGILITNNIMDRVYNTGIHIMDNLKANQEISSNTISDACLYGIYAKVVNETTTSTMNIKSNVIETNTLITGVFLQDIHQPEVTENTIKYANTNNNAFTTNTVRSGIHIESSPYASITKNIVMRTNTAQVYVGAHSSLYARLKGIYVNKSFTSLICSNTLENLGADIFMEGSCKNARIRSNIMNNTHSGVVLENADISGPDFQPVPGIPTDNSWSTIYGNDMQRRITGSILPTAPATVWSWRTGTGLSPNTHTVTGPFSTASVVYLKKVDCNTEATGSKETQMEDTNSGTASITGFASEQQLTVNVFPNPTEGYITLSFSSAVNDAFVTITDANGKIILKNNLNADVTTLDVSGLTSGSYFYKITGNDIIFNGRFIKK